MDYFSSNYKQELSANAKESLKIDVSRKTDAISTESEEIKNLFISTLKEENNPQISYESISSDDFKLSRTILSKTNYHFPDVLKVGELVNEKYIPSKILQDTTFFTRIPLFIPIRNSGIGFIINSKQKDRINEILELCAYKLISSLPDGLTKVTLIDKAGSGQNFPKLSTLHEKFLEGKVLSEDNEIERELDDIKQSMSAITQSISANGFSSIEDYNLNTDEVPQQYNIICVSGFPTGFNKKSTENLLSLIESGHKAGIYILASFSYDPIYGFNQNINGISLNQLLKHLTVFDFIDRPHELVSKQVLKENVEIVKFPLKNEEKFKNLVNTNYKINLESIPEIEMKTNIKTLNEIIQSLNLKPIIDIKKIIPTKDFFWTKNASLGVCVPFAKKGIENVFLSLGINQYDEVEATHHGLIGGATGSGKTVLINDIILMSSILYSPRELQFYLLDYKEGTEFAIYKDLPSVKILSMDSEIEFGHEVLSKAILLMEERGKLFKEVGAQNLFTYNKAVPEDKKLPRIIIIIDEFQNLLPKDQRIASKTNEYLDRILRLGRSFGINLLLATQTLKGVELDQSIYSNMPLRIALKMDEKDAIKIFSEGNSAPKFLKDSGEGIYNKSYGDSKQNVHFQAFLAIGDRVRELKDMLIQHMEENLPSKYLNSLKEERFVYNGETPGEYSSNHLINLDKPCTKLYLGEPAGLNKEHIFISFENDYADNLLIVGADTKKTASIFYYLIKQLLHCQPTATVNFSNFNTNLNPLFKILFENDLKNEKFNFITNIMSEDNLNELALELKRRQELIFRNEEKITFDKIYSFFYFIESAKIFSSTGIADRNLKIISDLIKNGPEVGMHFILFASSFSALTDCDMSRELNKFKKKIAVQGSNSNSLKIFGNEPSISFSKAAHVAIIDNGLSSKLFKFKPYIQPDISAPDDSVQHIKENL